MVISRGRDGIGIHIGSEILKLDYRDPLSERSVVTKNNGWVVAEAADSERPDSTSGTGRHRLIAFSMPSMATWSRLRKSDFTTCTSDSAATTSSMTIAAPVS